jgi:hypothetical protein
MIPNQSWKNGKVQITNESWKNGRLKVFQINQKYLETSERDPEIYRIKSQFLPRPQKATALAVDECG